MNSVEWNPKYNLLAYAGDDKNKYQADEGNTRSGNFNPFAYYDWDMGYFLFVWRHMAKWVKEIESCPRCFYA